MKASELYTHDSGLIDQFKRIVFNKVIIIKA